MDHKATATNTIRNLLDVAKHLPAALAATEDSPLRSTPTDGGSRAVGSHSDPTPSSALRRRRTDERRIIDQLLHDLADTSIRLQRLVVKVTTPPAKVGPCRSCVRASQIVSPPHGVCVHCIKALDRARRRTPAGETFDASAWVAARYSALHTRATQPTTKGNQ